MEYIRNILWFLSKISIHSKMQSHIQAAAAVHAGELDPCFFLCLHVLFHPPKGGVEPEATTPESTVLPLQTAPCNATEQLSGALRRPAKEPFPPTAGSSLRI